MNRPFRIACLIERLGWSQPQMADYLGLRQASVSRMVNGQVETGPVVKLLDSLAIARDWPDLTAERFSADASEPAA